MRINTFLRVVLLAGGLALFAAACGDDDSASDSDDSTPTDTDDGGTDDTGDDDTGDDDTGDDGSDDGEDPAALLEGTWDITTYQLAGAAGEATPVGEPTITFDGAGGVTFDTGCNTGEGEYEPFGGYGDTGQPISFGSLSRTEVGCDDELGDQDLAIPGAIRAADLFQFVDGDLFLWRDGNIMIEGVRR